MEKVKTLKASSGEVISIEIITPEIAKELMKKNLNNRKMKEVTMDKYARDMKNGKWTFSGSSICISKEGILLDGQTRLQACIQSDTPFETIVVRECRDESKKNVDVGNSRTVADILQISGINNSNNLASTAKKILSMGVKKDSRRIAFSSDEIIEELTKEDRRDFYIQGNKFASDIFKEYRIIPKSCITAAYVKLCLLGHSGELIQEFFDQLSDQKPACGTVRSLRKRVSKVDGRSVSIHDKFILLIKAWNEFSKGNFDANIMPDMNKDVDFI